MTSMYVLKMSDRQIKQMEAGFKTHKEAEAKKAPFKAALAKSEQIRNDARYDLVIANQARWTTVENVDCLRVNDSKYIAIPVTGRKNSKKFDVIDLTDRSDIVCQLKSTEVYEWLLKAHIGS